MLDPHLRYRQMIMEIDHPKLGKITQVGNPFKLSDTPSSFRNFSPFPGQHTNEILREIGYNKQQIEKLRNDGDLEYVKPLGK